jgi:serine/threonine protein kinase
MLGTVAFSAPEQLRGGPLDGRADLFSLGATLFTLIAGRRIHEPRKEEGLALAMLTKPAPPLASVADKAPDNVCKMVDRALAHLPDHRYPDARTMRGDLWAVRKRERPPYAWACEQAGMDAHATEIDRPTSPEPGPARASDDSAARIPTTAPQMPAFLIEEPRVEKAPVVLPSTRPQMPVLDDGDSPASDAPASGQPSAEEEEAAREATLRGGFESPRQWRTDPRWPLPKKKEPEPEPEEEEP